MLKVLSCSVIQSPSPAVDAVRNLLIISDLWI